MNMWDLGPRFEYRHPLITTAIYTIEAIIVMVVTIALLAFAGFFLFQAVRWW